MILFEYASFVLFLVSIKNCWSFVYWDEASIMSRGPDQNLFDYASEPKLKEDIQLAKEMLPDVADTYKQSETSEVLQQAINTEFSMLVSNLALEDDVSFDAKMDAINRALESAYLKTTGNIDRRYIDGMLSMIRDEVDKRRLWNREHQFNSAQMDYMIV